MQKIYLLITSLLLATNLLIGQELTNVTDVTLTFTPVGGGTVVTATAQDSDGDGPNGFSATSAINLLESTEYTLSIDVQNSIDNVDQTAAITADNNNFLFFFGFTDGVFTSPAGDGNIDNRMDPMNYDDSDGNGLPVGINTLWETICADEAVGGTFQIRLQYQPGTKSASSSSTDGTNEFDITWDINITEDPDAPPCENEEEIITDVVLTFTPVGGGDVVTASAQDPDGFGPLPIATSGPIDLLESTEYEMSITLTNSIENEDITEEIMEEDDEHQFFFAFTDEVFTSPAGDGNIDNRDDPVNYNDFDENNLPVGLSTDWETVCADEAVDGSFQVVLKHQPDLKSATTTAQDGGTDVDLTWTVNIIQDADAPPCENEEEIITDVVLTFTPVGGGDVVTASAQDPDGFGPLPIATSGPIDLLESTEYEMSITLTNSIENEDITEEIMEEDDEHQFFFAFTDEVFTSPAGDGNIDNRDDPVNYNDFDENNLPVGLSTNWETVCADEAVDGSFQVVLKHQPDLKSATTTAQDGGTDVDLTWTVNIIQDADAPPCENEEEIITDVTLTFTPVGGGDVEVVGATDPDGFGPLPIATTGNIDLANGIEYTLSIELTNSIENEDITEEIMEEDDEHMFFFEWTDGVFSNPSGDGNIDNRDDPVNYLDEDENMLPVGLQTRWITAADMQNGSFRVVLKHQPDLKSATTTAQDGGTDIDITWNVGVLVSIEEVQLRNANLKISPNPVQTKLQWELDEEGVQNGTYAIYDMFGQLIEVNAVQQINGIQSLDVTQLKAGTYLFQIRSDELTWTQRFVKLN